MDYKKLMDQDPLIYESMVNSIGQEIDFAEHPMYGDESPVICICHELGLARISTFFETDDMMAKHGEYEPKFIDGDFYIGDFKS